MRAPPLPHMHLTLKKHKRALTPLHACTLAGGPDDAAMAASRISSEPSTSQPGSNLGGMTNAEVDNKRRDFHIKRAYDGRVALFNKETREFWDLKLDMKYPGMLLFRSPSEAGQIYLLAYQKLQQVGRPRQGIGGIVGQRRRKVLVLQRSALRGEASREHSWGLNV